MTFRTPISAATVRALISAVVTAVTGLIVTELTNLGWDEFAGIAIAEMAGLRILLEGWLFDTQSKSLQGQPHQPGTSP